MVLIAIGLLALNYFLSIYNLTTGVAYIIRACEAVALRKRLLSNNKFLEKAPFYKPDQFMSFDDVENVDIDMILKPINVCPDEAYSAEMNELSPLSFIHRIDCDLGGAI